MTIECQQRGKQGRQSEFKTVIQGLKQINKYTNESRQGHYVEHIVEVCKDTRTHTCTVHPGHTCAVEKGMEDEAL